MSAGIVQSGFNELCESSVVVVTRVLLNIMVVPNISQLLQYSSHRGSTLSGMAMAMSVIVPDIKYAARCNN